MSLEYYNEIKKNLTWYQLNSDYKDPMYQYMLNISKDVNLKVISPLLKSNYSLIDDYVANSKNEILRYGSYQCSVPGKEAYWDSAFSCLLFQLPFFLESIQIGYIGFVFIIPIMLISIFGGIKESYRWFILNQAIWDAFLCYDFICTKPTLLGWSNTTVYTKQNTCFYRNEAVHPYVYFTLKAFRLLLRNASFIPIFHLALSRFLAMYFSKFYKNFTKNGYKILIFIIVFNTICLLIFAASPLSLVAFGGTVNYASCDVFCSAPQNATYCNQNIPKYFQCQNGKALKANELLKEQRRIERIFRYISYSIPPLMFLLSIICAGFLFYKVASQLKFQLKTNQDSFKQTIKISFVVGFQCLTMSVIFMITGIQKFFLIQSENDSVARFLDINIYNTYDNIPPWLFLLQYYTTTASLNMIRILLDSCIILTVLTGYSKCVISFLKIFYLCVTNPKQAFKKIQYIICGSKVTTLSTSQK